MYGSTDGEAEAYETQRRTPYSSHAVRHNTGSFSEMQPISGDGDHRLAIDLVFRIEHLELPRLLQGEGQEGSAIRKLPDLSARLPQARGDWLLLGEVPALAGALQGSAPASESASGTAVAPLPSAAGLLAGCGTEADAGAEAASPEAAVLIPAPGLWTTSILMESLRKFVADLHEVVGALHSRLAWCNPTAWALMGLSVAGALYASWPWRRRRLPEPAPLPVDWEV